MSKYLLSQNIYFYYYFMCHASCVLTTSMYHQFCWPLYAAAIYWWLVMLLFLVYLSSRRPNRGHILFSTPPSPFIISALLWFQWRQYKETPFIIVRLDSRALESQVGLSPQAPSTSLRERQETACLESEICVLICTVFAQGKCLNWINLVC